MPKPTRFRRMPEVFADWTPLDRDIFEQRSARRQVPAGAAVIREGEPGREFFVVAAGTVRLSRGGREVATLGAGDYFGELALLQSQPRNATVEAATDVDLLVLQDREFRSLVAELPAFSSTLLQGSARRLRDASTERTWSVTLSRSRPVVLAPHRRRRPGRKAAMAALAATIVVLLGTDVFLLSERNRSSPVSLQQALGAFRNRAAASTATAAAATPGRAEATASAAAPAAAATAAPARAASPAPAAARASRKVGGAPALAPAAPAGPSGYAPPAEGVYSYRTAGGESISVVGAHHEYPDRIFSSVRHLGGCRWENRSDVIKEHVDRRVLCSEPDRFSQLEQTREVEFFHKRDSGTFRCNPPEVQQSAGDVPGTSDVGVCRDDHGGEARIVRTFVGREHMKVGGIDVEVAHVELRSTMTGRATGHAADSIWLVATSGLPVKWDRSVDTLADAAFGARVRYTEKVTFVLDSLTPRT